jgi:hypothetical protein
MKKSIITYIACVLGTIVLLSLSTEAAYPDYHTYILYTAWDQVTSPITQMCAGRLDLINTGEKVTDAPVIHYLEGGKKIASYIGTHTASAYIICTRNAGADLDQKCFCIGNVVHPTSGDVSSHLEQVPSYIKKFWFLNIPVHLTVEKAMEMKLEDYLLRHPESRMSWEEVEIKTQYSFDPMFEDEKYMKLLDKMSGIDMRTDVAIVGAALKGGKWQSTVYGKQVYLPSWSYAIGIGLMFISGLLLFVVYKWGSGWFKWVVMIELGVMFVLGLLIFLSLLLGTSWLWFDAMMSVPASMISISDDEFEHYLNQDIARTKLVLQDGVNRYTDWTGLSYISSTGADVNGELSKAESRFWWVLMPISTIITVGWGYLNYKWVFRKKKRW